MEDITNKRFSELLVVGYAGKKVQNSGQSKHFWACVCDCGQTKDIIYGNLVRGIASSCGICRSTRCRDVMEGSTINGKYGKFVVTRYVSAREIYVEFVDTGFKCLTDSRSIKVGCVKDWMKPIIKGVGYFGVGDYDTKTIIHESGVYGIWKNMIERCYASTDTCRPTYVGCTVVKEWHNFQNFAKWYDDNHPRIDGFELDKDFRLLNNKVYSPDTCSFVPDEVNNFLTGTTLRRKDKRHVAGVAYLKRSNRWQVAIGFEGFNKSFGSFRDRYDAELVYKSIKEMLARRLADKWKDVLHPDVYNSLKTFEVTVDYPR